MFQRFFRPVARLSNQQLGKIAGGVLGLTASIYVIVNYGSGMIISEDDGSPIKNPTVLLKVFSSMIASAIVTAVSSVSFGKLGDCVDQCTGEGTIFSGAYKLLYGTGPELTVIDMPEPTAFATPKGHGDYGSKGRRAVLDDDDSDNYFSTGIDIVDADVIPDAAQQNKKLSPMRA